MGQLRRPDRAGFSLIEAMVALSLAAMAGAAVLLTIETAIDASDQAHEQLAAAGMAEQLLDEAVGAMYLEPGAGALPRTLGASGWERRGVGRERFNEIGDYHTFAAQPPQDRWGRPLGAHDDEGGLRHPNFQTPASAFARWRQTVEVFYLNPDDLSVRRPAGQTSDFLAVEAVISRQTPDGKYVELARRRRVVAYLPNIPHAS